MDIYVVEHQGCKKLTPLGMKFISEIRDNLIVNKETECDCELPCGEEVTIYSDGGWDFVNGYLV